MSAPNVEINAEQLMNELNTLGEISDAPPPAVTRVLFTTPDLKARAYLTQLMRDADLHVRQDAIGNIFARWGDPKADGAIGTGSHTDAIPYSGRFDGTVGVLGGLEAIRSLQRAGFKPTRPIELLMFTSEEPTRFGLGCLGSRLLSAAVPMNRIRALTDSQGKTVEQVREENGCAGTLESVQLPQNYYSAFVELHIEQGPILEKENLPIGVVTAIAAPAALRVQFTGEGGHAGVVLMPDRRDALLAAAEVALAVESAAKSSGSPDSVATTGLFTVHPGAANSIPSQVTIEIDVRDADLASRDKMVSTITTTIQQIGQKRQIETKIEMLNADPPAQCAPAIVSAVESAARQIGAQPRRMVSRAYHDSLFMARIAPTGMIFIPCRKGYSHRPDEYASAEHIAQGTKVLALTLAQLAT